MYTEFNYKKSLLLRYLKQYLLKKDLRMKNVLKNIVNRLENNQPITMKQYNSVIKFIEREKEFKSSNRTEILTFFEPLIEPTQRKVFTNGNDLTEHFV